MKIFFIVRRAPPVISARSIQLDHWMKHLRPEFELISETRLEAARAKAPPLPPPLLTLRRCLGQLYRAVLPTTVSHYRSALPMLKDFRRRFEAAGSPSDAVVFTVSKSDAPHLAGLRISQKLGLPWAAFFSDPWTNNSYEPLKRLDRLFQKHYEKKVLERAGLLLFPTEEMRDGILARHPQYLNKSGVVPHAFDPELFSGARRRADRDTYIIRHLGNFYQGRRPHFLMEAFRIYLEKFPEEASVFRFEFYGKPGAFPESVTWPESRKYFRFYPMVAPAESMRLTREADRLLVLDAQTAENIYRPSKLVEAVGARRPVWAITQPRSPTEALTQKMPGCVVSRLADVKSVHEALHGFHRCFREGTDLEWEPPAEVYETHLAAKVTARMEELLERILPNHKKRIY